MLRLSRIAAFVSWVTCKNEGGWLQEFLAEVETVETVFEVEWRRKDAGQRFELGRSRNLFELRPLGPVSQRRRTARQRWAVAESFFEVQLLSSERSRTDRGPVSCAEETFAELKSWRR